MAVARPMPAYHAMEIKTKEANGTYTHDNSGLHCYTYNNNQVTRNTWAAEKKDVQLFHTDLF